MESDYHWLVTVGLVTSSVIAVAANSFLLVVFARRRGLRTVPNRFIINLLITNLLSSILLIPLLLVDQQSELTVTNGTLTENATVEELNSLVIREDVLDTNNKNNIEIIETGEGIITESVRFLSGDNLLLCRFAQGTTSFVCTASIFSILLIGVNQYFGVIHSLRYHFYINRCRSTVFIAASWLAALVCAVLGSFTHSGNALWHFCEKPDDRSDLERVFDTVYVFGYFLVVILVPFAAICVIYVCIYAAAHGNSERVRKSTSAHGISVQSAAPSMDYIRVPLEEEKAEILVAKKGTRNELPKVHSAPNFSQLERGYSDGSDSGESGNQKYRNKVKRTCSDRNSSNFIMNLKHRISNASLFRYREETRAAKISVLVIFLVLICYLPYGVSLILGLDSIRVRSSEIFNYLSLVLLVFSNILSPFLFGYRNKRVKREIGKIFGAIPDSNGDLNGYNRRPSLIRRSVDNVGDPYPNNCEKNFVVPEVVVTYKENERKSILKRVGGGWSSYKKCNFITVPDSCLGEARGSFSSASTQISNEE